MDRHLAKSWYGRTLLTLGLSLATVGDGWSEGGDDWADLSLEELMDTKVTLVSRKAERLSEAPAAISVITREDIRHAGITSIPEALRLAPGLHVARIDANKWAISARGFHHRFANKLLVQIDGRSVYNFSFSGVYWEGQDLLLEDVERIEVIRGPGATLWGANAVNGVINIITRQAEETQGFSLEGGAGTNEQSLVGVRYGVQLGKGLYGRGYAKYLRRGSSAGLLDTPPEDAWEANKVGFRVDWARDESNRFNLQGDYYSNAMDQRLVLFDGEPPYSVSAIEAVGKWQAAPWWRMTANYTYMHMDLRRRTTDDNAVEGQSLSQLVETGEQIGDLRHMAQLHSALELPI